MDGLHLSSALMSTLETRGHVSLRTVSERKRVQPTELSLNRFITSLSSETSCSVRPTLSLSLPEKQEQNISTQELFCHVAYMLLNLYKRKSQENLFQI